MTPTPRSSRREGEPAAVVVAALGHHSGAASEGGYPGGDVRRLAARREGCPRRGVRSGCERLLQPHDHVEKQVAERADHGFTILPWTSPSVGDRVSARSSSAAPSAPRPRRRAATGPPPPTAPGSRPAWPRSRAPLATGSCSIGAERSAVAAKHAVGALDGEEVHVRVADAERAAEQLCAAREEQVAIRCDDRLPRPDHEEGPEAGELECRWVWATGRRSRARA